VAEAIIFKRSERQRLARLAREADCGIGDILRDVLRDGFDYTEYKVKAVNEGLADLSAGRVMSLDQLKARLARRRAERGRARRKVA
jgi:predicted transcriptional regulator